MGKRIDLTGRKIGRLTVISYSGNNKWFCECECGNARDVNGESLRKGAALSCGCLNKERTREKNIKGKDLTGKRFGRLLVLQRANDKGQAKYYCKCNCGNEIVISGQNLSRGDSRSCGCLKKERDQAKCLLHGDTKTKFYRTWANMVHRCNHKDYKYYGGRGIEYEPRWKNYINFRSDMHPLYLSAKEKYPNEVISLERIDVNGDYCKDNCIFIPNREQSKNTRRTTRKFIAISPHEQIIISSNSTCFAKQHGLGEEQVRRCLRGEQERTNNWWRFRWLDEPIKSPLEFQKKRKSRYK